MANSPHVEGDDSDDGEVFLEDADVLHEIHVDEEDIPDDDDDDDDDLDDAGEVDDSLYVFRGHSGYPYHTDDTDGLTCLSITLDSKIAITGSKYGSIRTVNIDTGKLLKNGLLGSGYTVLVLVALNSLLTLILCSVLVFQVGRGLHREAWIKSLSFGISNILLCIAVVNMKKVYFVCHGWVRLAL